MLRVNHVTVESSRGDKLPDCQLVLTHSEVRAAVMLLKNLMAICILSV